MHHLHVYALADMLDVPDLKALVTKKLQAQLEKEWSNLAEVLKEAYSITNTRDKEIRGVLVALAVENLDELLKKEDFTGALNEVAEFSGALVMAMKAVPVAPTIQKPGMCQRCLIRSCYFYCSNCGVH
jgi:geranylgeranyl pyrophosphate synthase